jgi:hypothetical protein
VVEQLEGTLTEAQILGAIGTAIVVASGVIAAAVRWSAKLVETTVVSFRETIVKAINDNTDSNRERVKAEQVSVQRFIVLETKIDEIHDWVHEHTPVRGVPVFADDAVPSEMPSERRMREPSERRRPVPARPFNGHSIDPPSDPGTYHYTKRGR